MNREIKFRCWNKKQEKMFQWQELLIAKSEFIFEWINVNKEFEFNVLQQYTGLKDKNGVEIYESDICKVDNGDNTYEVIFYFGGFKIAVLPRKIRIYNIGDSLFKNIEVIGNIYHNPDLLK